MDAWPPIPPFNDLGSANKRERERETKSHPRILDILLSHPANTAQSGAPTAWKFETNPEWEGTGSPSTGGAGAGVVAATVGLIALDAGLLAYDVYKGYQLAQAYGYLLPNPKAKPAPAPKCSTGRQARCTLTRVN